ncbi:MAG: hypothetical protein A2W72_01545 [Burkholderiales bacterium RIFCSPLOWO2_12_67_14]|nr:MAG: hypothetical protein A3I64_07220 [Burkholderiales bacterium RIFCSPLOWO2_02_FULL_67_64]OGB40027.1 MAG: hypothetical protein A3E51_05505 [Burkholderiales bacterium RIFCSPHIGHO2_12_FULL_67_38]OGB46817.1 MAG: hypothetical protein A2W72_01545 [Burkholderiales bacterium RIFCSPLOWO2_12_67_14]OGB75920.1 MAG: hypothetical protein A3G82_07310 [Burkholderiales bacterium RIFCSPLOWO2_12_FULL_67_210]
MNIKTALLALTCLAVSPAWAINKCTIDGRVVFQDAPCPGKGETLVVRPASGRGASAAPPQTPPPAADAPAIAPATAPAQPLTQGNRPAAKSPLEVEADMCLAWYRPLLRDPHGAYYTNLTKEKRVFSMDLHATNGYGGYVIKRAACEIHNGKLNEAWTKNHAKWGGWAVE